MNKSRYPLSPHLQVYRLPLTAWLSIAHRVTGILLVLGVVAFTIGLVILANYPLTWQIVGQLSTYRFAQFVLIILCFSFWLHWCHGLRHLIWDTGRGFDLKYARLVDSLEIMFAVLFTVAVWINHSIFT